MAPSSPPQDCGQLHRGVGADAHARSDHDRVRVDIRVGVDLGHLGAQGVDGHGPVRAEKRP